MNENVLVCSSFHIWQVPWKVKPRSGPRMQIPFHTFSLVFHIFSYLIAFEKQMPHMGQKNKAFLQKSPSLSKNSGSGTLVAWGFLCVKFLTPAQESAKWRCSAF